MARRLLAVPVRTNPTFSRGRQTVAVDGDYQLTSVASAGRRYDIDPSGERFLLVKAVDGGNDFRSSLNLVLNWNQELLERVPVD